MKYIELVGGNIAIVDNDNYDWLNQWKWYRHSEGYAVRVQHVKLGFKKYKNKTIRMHILVNKTPSGFQTDHLNENRLDNRRCNLRTCTKSENMQNRGKTAINTSGYKGVYLNKRVKIKKWMSMIQANGKSIYLGYFKTKKEAALAYNKAASKYHGRYANFNEII
jgi:hypothetical protein